MMRTSVLEILTATLTKSFFPLHLSNHIISTVFGMGTVQMDQLQTKPNLLSIVSSLCGLLMEYRALETAPIYHHNRRLQTADSLDRQAEQEEACVLHYLLKIRRH